MTKRSFGGYLCHESLSSGLFGEAFRAVSEDGKEARIVVVDSRLGLRKNFSQALARHGTQLFGLVHPHVVSTIKVGRGKDDSLVVIETSIEKPVDLRSLIDMSSEVFNTDIAMSIIMGALRGLSYIHDVGIPHGGIHPRSILVDGRGITKVADFALARALTVAAAHSDDTELLSGLRGYVAPELALSNEPSLGSDVYAIGALISQLMWGRTTPPADEEGPIVDVVRGAMDTDPERRYLNASELESHMRNAITAAKLMVATATEVSEFVHGVDTRTQAGLDEETEELLGALAQEATRTDSQSLDDALAGLEDSVEDQEPTRNTTPPNAAYMGEATETELTHLERKPGVDCETEEDKVNRILREAPASAAYGRVSRQLAVEADYADVDETPLPVPRPFHADGTHVNEFVDIVGRQAATSAPFDPSEEVALPEIKKGRGFIYLTIIVFVLGMVFTALYTQTDLIRAAEEDMRTQKAAKEAELRDALPKVGKIVVTSDVENAAVWLYLGKTPMTSLPLSAGMVHELRVERAAYQPLFLSVAAQHWGGSENERKAYLSAELVAVEDEEEPRKLPAFPPEHDPPLASAGKGQGAIEVETMPAGAEVWLWVGTTPEMTLGGVARGNDYRFKVIKDGHRDAEIEIAEADWFLSGNADGPSRPEIQREVTLEAEERDRKGRKSSTSGRKDRK